MPIITKTRILFIHHGVGVGGAFINLLNIVSNIDKNRYDTHVIFIRDKLGRDIFVEKGISATFLENSFYQKFYMHYSHFETSFVSWYQPYIYLRVLLSWLLNAFYFAPNVLKKYKYDLVYLNSSVLSDWAFSAKKKKKKVILHLQETFTKGYFGIRRSIVRKIIKKNSNYIISICEYNAKALGLASNYSVIYNYADDRYFNSNKPNYSFNTPIRCLYVGGFSYIKGFITMVNSIKYLNSKCEIIFAGHYPKDRVDNGLKRKIKYWFSPYRQMKEALEILNAANDKVKIIGLQKDIFKTFNQIDILISPYSKSHFSRPIVEAFAMRKLVVTSDINGIDEIVKDGINGFIFEKNNPESLSIVIDKVLSLTEFKKSRILENAYEDAKEKYSSKNIFKIEQIINKIIDEDK